MTNDDFREKLRLILTLRSHIKSTMIKHFKIAQTLTILALMMNISIHLSPVMASLSGQTQITICSLYSARTIVIDKNGNEVPQPSERSKKKCQFCIAANTATILPDANHISRLQIAELKTKITKNQPHIVKLYAIQNHPSRAPPHPLKT